MQIHTNRKIIEKVKRIKQKLFKANTNLVHHYMATQVRTESFYQVTTYSANKSSKG